MAEATDSGQRPAQAGAPIDRPAGWATRLSQAARRRVDPSSLVLLRVVVGLLLFVSIVRFALRGWVEALLLAPSHHFTYPGFAWIGEPSPVLAYGLLAVVAVAALTLAAGLCVRVSAALAFFAFTWLELIDLTYYLNHYYFLSCLLLTFALVPPRPRGDGRIAAWELGLIRTQVGLVYVYAGIAKLHGDWLLRAQPLKIWLARHSDLAVIGPWMDEPWLAYAASWAGAVFDLLIVPALLWRPTRVPAYLAVVAFHLVTGLLFPIGMFPWFMIGAATILFAPDWPRRWLPKRVQLDRPRPERWPRAAGLAALAAALVLAVQLALPWRHLLHPGPVLWNEQGGRFAYRVMLVEKAGVVEYRVIDRRRGRRFAVDPAEELTALQVKMMSTQPDMIAAYAEHLAARLAAATPGGAAADFEVRAEAFVAINGRPHARLIDPTVDLSSAERRGEAWILPAPEGLR